MWVPSILPTELQSPLAQLQEAVKAKPGGQAGNSNASKNDAPHRGASNPDPTVAELQEAVKSGDKGGRPPKGDTAAHRAAVKDPTPWGE
jgi:hypothetical protein